MNAYTLLRCLGRLYRGEVRDVQTLQTMLNKDLVNLMMETMLVFRATVHPKLFQRPEIPCATVRQFTIEKEKCRLLGIRLPNELSTPMSPMQEPS